MQTESVLDDGFNCVYLDVYFNNIASYRFETSNNSLSSFFLNNIQLIQARSRACQSPYQKGIVDYRAHS